MIEAVGAAANLSTAHSPAAAAASMIEAVGAAATLQPNELQSEKRTAVWIAFCGFSMSERLGWLVVWTAGLGPRGARAKVTSECENQPMNMMSMWS